MKPRVALVLTLSALLATSCGTASRPDRDPAPGRADASPGERAGEGQNEAAEALFNETVLYVIADGLAHRQPDAASEASMRIAKDERYRILEQRPGWYRLETEWKEIPAWVPEAALRTATEPAPVHVINRRLGSDP